MSEPMNPAVGDRRLSSGGRIDRNRPIGFEFNNHRYVGFAGDTLASALLACDVRVIGRSTYLSRPRGIFGSGPEEPNGLVQVLSPTGSEPMLRATQVELVDGLRAVALAGRGWVDPSTAGSRFDKSHGYADAVVIGAGPAGLKSALSIGRTGARVFLIDDGAEAGGSLLAATSGDRVDDQEATRWLASTIAELREFPDIRILARTTVLGLYDHGLVIAAQRLTGHPGALKVGRTEGRLWQIRAQRVVLASGATERPIVFPGNDRPGVMLASAARAYVDRWAVRPGRRAVIFTTNDSGLSTIASFERGGVDVAAVVDTRRNEAVVATEAGADGVLAGVHVGHLAADHSSIGDTRFVPCDLLAVAGGWNPAVGLWTHSGGTLHWRDDIAAFVPANAVAHIEAVGGAAGDGLPSARAYWRAPMEVDGGGRGMQDGDSEAFVDLERDATVADVSRALAAGLTNIEHVKRFTTIGTASDQGRTSSVLLAGLVSAMTGRAMGDTRPPTARPPAAPVSFAMLAGRRRKAQFDPVRTTPIHSWHEAHGAAFEDVGQWKRPWFYPLAGESMNEAVERECAAARSNVAVIDVSTLGKIDLQGPDVGTFLDRIYVNRFSTLRVGSCRYGLMCKPDGMVFDDGVSARISPTRYHMTTTTGNAAAVLDHLEEWLQTEWPDLRVRCTSVTEQWATVAVVGPRSRDVLRNVAPELDLSVEAFPFMTWRESKVAGIHARVFRISFSGELAYEINVPGRDGLAVWDAVVAGGRALGITPYGTEALHVLRAEKGYPIIGQETDGTVTPSDLGLESIVSQQKEFIGRRSLKREDLARAGRKQLVGLLPAKVDELVPEGAQLVNLSSDLSRRPVAMEGYVTSSYRSVALNRTFALGLVQRGRDRLGETLLAPVGGRAIEVTIAAPKLFDPEDLRRDG